MNEQLHTVSILAHNNTGVIMRVSNLLCRRGYNIQSLAAAHTENPGISRMTIVVSGDDSTIEQVCKQLSKLYDVTEVRVLNSENSIGREHLLLKAANRPETRRPLLEVANLFHANILNADRSSIVMELTGTPKKLDSFIELAQPYGIEQMVRTGLAAIEIE